MNLLEQNLSAVVLLLAALCAVLLIALIAGRRRPRAPLDPGEEVRRDLAEIARRLAALEQGVSQIAAALPRAVQGVGLVRYNPFPDMGGNMSFSVALLDAHADGVVISVLNDREGARVYGKPVERGASTYPLSDEEQQALALARPGRRA